MLHTIYISWLQNIIPCWMIMAVFHASQPGRHCQCYHWQTQQWLRTSKKSNGYHHELSRRTGKVRKWYPHTQTCTSNNSTQMDKQGAIARHRPTRSHKFVWAVCRCVITRTKAHEAVSSTAWRQLSGQRKRLRIAITAQSQAAHCTAGPTTLAAQNEIILKWLT